METAPYKMSLDHVNQLSGKEVLTLQFLTGVPYKKGSDFPGGWSDVRFCADCAYKFCIT